MRFDEAEKEIFERLIDEFTKRYGPDSLFALHKLHKQSKKLGCKNFPIVAIRNHALFLSMKDAGIKNIKDIKQYLRDNGFANIRGVDDLIPDYRAYLKNHKSLCRKLTKKSRRDDERLRLPHIRGR